MWGSHRLEDFVLNCTAGALGCTSGYSKDLDSDIDSFQSALVYIFRNEKKDCSVKFDKAARKMLANVRERERAKFLIPKTQDYLDLLDRKVRCSEVYEEYGVDPHMDVDELIDFLAEQDKIEDENYDWDDRSNYKPNFLCMQTRDFNDNEREEEPEVYGGKIGDMRKSAENIEELLNKLLG